MDYFPYIIGILVVVIALVVFLGPTGKTKEKINQIKGGKQLTLSEIYKKMTGFKGDYEKANDAAKEGESGAQAKADKYYARYKKYKRLWEEAKVEHPKEARELEEKWKIQQKRMKYFEKQELPPDDPIERNRRLLRKKYKDLKKLDATLGTGVLNCPDIPCWTDPAKTESSGKMSHEEWVKVLDSHGSGESIMFKVQRRNDRKEGWVEGKFIRDIYNEAKLANLKLKDKSSGGSDTDREEEDDDSLD
jgi:hypothetical protein